MGNLKNKNSNPSFRPISLRLVGGTLPAFSLVDEIRTGENKSGEKKKMNSRKRYFGIKLVVALIAVLGLICFIVGMVFSHGQLL